MASMLLPRFGIVGLPWMSPTRSYAAAGSPRNARLSPASASVPRTVALGADRTAGHDGADVGGEIGSGLVAPLRSFRETGEKHRVEIARKAVHRMRRTLRIDVRDVVQRR
ncbi:MAG: hypothetical protein SGJ11_09400 [Phycisphaerae bacterium]|nr:hypothetical protein [Phycisphaerae bacterium]